MPRTDHRPTRFTFSEVFTLSLYGLVLWVYGAPIAIINGNVTSYVASGLPRGLPTSLSSPRSTTTATKARIPTR